MTEPAGDTTEPIGPPADRVLLDLGADDWSVFLGHVRAALNDLDDNVVDPAVKRLRSAPAGRLAGGRMRRDLVSTVTSRPGLWPDLRDRLASDPTAAGLGWLVSGDPPPEPVAPVRPRSAAANPEPDPDREARRARRLQDVREERDSLRRQLDGAEARASRAEGRIAELETTVKDLRAQVDRLTAAAAAERERTDSAVEREQRRHAATIADLEGKLTETRRELDSIAQARRAAERSREAAQDRRARGEQPAAAEAGSDVRPGRPSRLPAGMRLDTTEGATALLRSASQVFVDGWNVTMTNWAGLPIDQQRQRLRLALETAATRYGLHVTVVWDGQGEGDQARARGVTQVFTPEGTTADDDLVFRVAALPDDEPVVVVTDDAELRRRLQEWQPDLLNTRPFVWAIQ